MDNSLRRIPKSQTFPDELADRIRARAVADRRSLTQEIIYLLEQALADPTDSLETRWQREGALQVEAWSHLAGQWQSERATSEDTEALHQPRSGEQDTVL